MKPDYSHAITLAFWVGLVLMAVLILSSCVVEKTQTPTVTPLQIASKSTCIDFVWKDRGKAPASYIFGMASVYARQFCINKYKGSLLAAKKEVGSNDALAVYATELHKTIQDGGELRALYSLMIGLGMRESSGKYCEGRDASAENTSSITAEAGMFQTSFNAVNFSPELRRLFDYYKADATHCILKEFSKGVSCRSGSERTWGEAQDGRDFQELSKRCPAFAAEFSAIVLRLSGGKTGHYGPIRRKEVEVPQQCINMLAEVEGQLNSQTCGELLK